VNPNETSVLGEKLTRQLETCPRRLTLSTYSGGAKSGYMSMKAIASALEVCVQEEWSLKMRLGGRSMQGAVVMESLHMKTISNESDKCASDIALQFTMSFDLYFCIRTGNPPNEDLRPYFGTNPLALNDLQDGGAQFWYDNPASAFTVISHITASMMTKMHKLLAMACVQSLNYIRPSLRLRDNAAGTTFLRAFQPLVETCKKRLSATQRRIIS